MLNEIFSLAPRSNGTVCSPLPGSLIVYVPPFIEPPILEMVNVADKSLLQATPKPRYGSGSAGVFVGAGVKVWVGVAVGVEVAVLAARAAALGAQVASALATPVPGWPGRWLTTMETLVPG